MIWATTIVFLWTYVGAANGIGGDVRAKSVEGLALLLHSLRFFEVCEGLAARESDVTNCRRFSATTCHLIIFFFFFCGWED